MLFRQGFKANIREQGTEVVEEKSEFGYACFGPLDQNTEVGWSYPTFHHLLVYPHPKLSQNGTTTTTKLLLGWILVKTRRYYICPL
jgi:hypothetical protein